MPEKKKSQKAGRNKNKCGAYRTHQVREKHKIVKVYRSSGKTAALAYAKLHNLTSWATVRLDRFTAKVNHVPQQRSISRSEETEGVGQSPQRAGRGRIYQEKPSV